MLWLCSDLKDAYVLTLSQPSQLDRVNRLAQTFIALRERQKRMLDLGLAIKNLLNNSPGNVDRTPHVSALLDGWNETKLLQPHLNNLEATLKGALTVRTYIYTPNML